MNRATQRKGDIALTQAIATFTRLGYDVSVPVTESAAYDLIVDYQGTLYKVQAKYCNGIQVNLTRVHSNSQGYVVKKYTETCFDWLYVFAPDSGEYLFKTSLAGRRSINIGTMEKLS